MIFCSRTMYRKTETSARGGYYKIRSGFLIEKHIFVDEKIEFHFESIEIVVNKGRKFVSRLLRRYGPGLFEPARSHLDRALDLSAFTATKMQRLRNSATSHRISRVYGSG
jgi:hypothetical protein